jgi:hypothetical protein
MENQNPCKPMDMIMFMEKFLDDIILTNWVQVFAVEEALIPDAFPEPTMGTTIPGARALSLRLEQNVMSI